MKILIIGATGKTGRELIKQGLELGHNITALVRKPKDLKLDHKNLKILQGNVLNPQDLDKAVKGQEAVLSALGHKKFILPSSLLSKGTENLITAMDKQEVKRLLCITSLSLNDSRFKLGLYYTLFVIPFILFFYFRDKEKQERLIKKSQLTYTIVRPGQLTNGKKRGLYRHGPDLGSYILTKLISRADVAHFMLNELSKKLYINKTVAIIY